MSGGTVTYHRAEYNSDDDTWRVWFRKHSGYYSFSGAEGEAMGLTVPEPAPLVVECNGHRIELSDEQVQAFINTSLPAAYGTATREIGNLLRDARQDPQPTVDSEPWPWGDEGFMCPKMVRETLCVAQGVVGRSPEVDFRRDEHVRRIQRMIDWCDRHRPIGPDGKHGTRRCTPTCGCEDKGEPITPVQRTVDSFTILDPKPAPPVTTVEIGGQVMTQAQFDAARFPLLNPGPGLTADTPSDDIDFDALPIGTVLERGDSIYVVQAGATVALVNPQTSNWHALPMAAIAAIPIPMRVVYQPPALSPRQHLEALLAGRDDADELIDYASKWWNYDPRSTDPAGRLLAAIGDAARGGA